MNPNRDPSFLENESNTMTPEVPNIPTYRPQIAALSHAETSGGVRVS